MGKFVARPVWVNAWHIVPEQVSLLPDWLKGGLVKRREKGKMRIGVYFEGMRGKTYAIEGIQGEFYPCKPDIFEQTYEKVEE